MPQNRFFPAYFRHFRPENFFFSKIGLRHILGIAILHHCAKNQKKLTSQPREKLVTGKCLKGISPNKPKTRNLRQKKIFQEKFFRPYFRVPCTLSFCQKSEKTNEAILHKVQKTLFLGSFWAKFAQKNTNFF